MNSVYKKEYHIAIPTLDFIKDITSFDLIQEEGTKERAEAKLLNLTLKAKDYLFSTRPNATQKALSYMIFKYPEWKEAWELYVAKYIDASFYSGDELFTNPPQTLKNAIHASILNVYQFTQGVYNEVALSTEEF